MRALILAAGKGTRLRPLTNNTPKCLLRVKEENLLDNWLKKIESCGIKEVFINTHYLHEQVENHVNKIKSSLKINLLFEKDLLGTAGTIKKNIKLFLNDDLLLIHADNYMEERLQRLIYFHKNRPITCLMTMLTFKTKTPETCGIICKNDQNILTSFIEKPKFSNSNLANGAVYVLSDQMIDELNNYEGKMFDFSNDIIPNYFNRIYTYFTDKFFIDIGSPETYSEAQKII